MIQSIEILWEPLVALGSCIIVFCVFDWVLGKVADLLGVEDNDEDW